MAAAVVHPVANLESSLHPSGQDDEQEDQDEPGGISPSVNLRDIFQRLLTYPLAWTACISKVNLVKNGFYFVNPSGLTDPKYYTGNEWKIACAFCNVTIDLTTLHSTTLQNLHLHNPYCEILNQNSSSNIGLEENNNFRYEKSRLVSFLVTSWTYTIDPYDLAKWGFYYTGSSDVARCYFCRLEVRGWEPGDTAEGEHRRWNRHCLFLANRDVGNIRLGQELETPTERSSCINNELNISFVGKAEHAGHLNYDDLGVTLTATSRHPEYDTVEQRIRSFNTWPLAIAQHPDDLAEAGFYYTGTGDRTICFKCGGGLKDWAPSDRPWREHALWFPTCSYLLVKKGRAFVQSVHHIPETQGIIDEPVEITHSASIVKATANRNAAVSLVKETNISSVSEELELKVDTSRLCKVCNKEELGMVFLPCGHMTTCIECAATCANCPTCSQKIAAYVRAYLP